MNIAERTFQEWQDICKAFCKKNNYDLVFVNATDFGYMTEDGQCVHLYIDELAELLKK